MNIYDRLINKFWRSIFIPSTIIRLNSSKFRVPRISINNFYESNYITENWFLKLLDVIHKHRPINTFFDVGVNIGQTLFKVKTINREINYYGFEPNPFCCAFMEQIISINNFSKCSIIPSGLGEKNSLVKLTIEKNNLLDSTASVVKGFRKPKGNEQFLHVPINKLDDIVHLLNCVKIDVIKIDIEGAELEAIKGMWKTIIKHNPVIILEVLPSYDSSNVFRITRQKELANILTRCEYSIFQIQNKNTNVKFVKVKEFPIHKNVNESDYILLPKDIHINSWGLKTA